MSPMDCLNDYSFGPVVQGCRDNFDFTQKFEWIFFWAAPAVLFIPMAIARVVHLASKQRLVGGSTLQLLKIVAIAVLAAVQLCLLVLSCTAQAVAVRGWSVAGLALVLAAGLSMIVVSFLEHARSRRTSALLNLYLLITLLFDMVQARTLWLTVSNTQANFTRIFTASISIKFIILCLETYGKSKWIPADATECSPEESSGVYSLALYYWLRRLFLKGHRSIMRLDDLYVLDKALSAETTTAQLMKKLNVQHTGRNHALLRALLGVFSWQFLAPVGPRLALVGFRYSQSFLLEALLDHLEHPERDSATNIGYGLIGACVLIYAGMAFSTAYFGYFNNRAACMSRACLCAAVYRKTTEISIVTANDAASVTLMSTDVEHIESGLLVMHQVWASLIETALGCWLLQTRLGIAFVTPIAVIIGCSGVLYWVLTFVENRQTVWMEKIQKRIAVTASAISDMKHFKILGIAARVMDLVQALRAEEIRAGNRFRVILWASVALSFIPSSLSPAITFAVTFRTLGVSTLFVSLSFMMLLSSPLTTLFQSLPVCLAALTSFSRIHTYLAEPSRSDFRHCNFSKPGENHSPPDGQTSASEKITETLYHPDVPPVPNREVDTTAFGVQPAFVVANGSFGWDEGKMVLRDLAFSIPSGKITMIVGPVASGKSTLCQALLGEIPIATGSTTIGFPDSPIGYCAPNPHLSNATLMENILGFSPFAQKKYDAIIDATMLGVDIGLLPAGHQTTIGSSGIILSGGQKKRVSLARALYLEPKVMIFDEVLSGLDMDTETEVFRRVFGPGGLTRQRGATAVISTNSKRHLSSADHIIVLGNDGRIVEQGPFEMLAISRRDLPTLEVKSTSSDARINPGAGGPEAGDPEAGDPEAGDAGAEDPPKMPARANAATTKDDDHARQTGDLTIYLHYLRNITKRSGVTLACFCILNGFCSNFSTVWMSYWSENAFHRASTFYLGVYGMLRAAEFISIIGAAAVVLINMVTSSGSNLHKHAITTVIRAPLNLFTTTDLGTLTNLFSQDMTLVDGELPLALLNASFLLFDLLGNCFVIAVASPYLAISYPFLIGILYSIQLFYLRTSRQLRLLDLEAKSPLYTHFLDTIYDLATIRAIGSVENNIALNNTFLNTSQRPAYLLAMIQEWLQTILLVLVGVIATIITTLATQLNTNSGFTGASLVTLLSLSATISSLMQCYTSLETSIGAVGRLRTFSQKVKPEDATDEDMHLPEQWPVAGSIHLSRVSAAYSGDENPIDETAKHLALKNLSLSIRSGEKVAICGRTGSGKSSLILLLLRLLDPLPSSHNGIEVDGLPLHRVKRTTLRERFITIPQCTVFLPGDATIKENLDPFDAITDEECLLVLERVRLAAFVHACGGLHANMSDNKLSSGQKQLFGLGRAVIRRRVRDKGEQPAGGVLLVDELNSGIDTDTDRTVQEIIRLEFVDYTVVLVAHRLDMVMSLCDRVFVLDNGEMVESGIPRILVAASESRFSKLYLSGI